MTRRLLAATVAVAALVLGLAGPAAAGGWAITTLDPLPAGGIAPGRPTPIGYTIRQHGVTPVQLTDSHLLVAMPDGTVLTFAGVPDRAPGHHVAMVTVPIAGHLTLTSDQGWFPDQDLGHLDVGAAGGTAGGDGWPTALLVATAAAAGAALALLAVQATMLVRGRRRAARLVQA